MTINEKITVAFVALCLSGVSAAAADLAQGCTSPDGTKCVIELDTGIRMTFLELGPRSGEPVILLHGLTDSVRSWAPTMAALHKADPSLRLIALDQRGHGGSSMPMDEGCPAEPKRCFTPMDFAIDLHAFMRQMDIAKATLVGHSMGSMVAQEMALDFPDRVQRLVLIASAHKTKDNPVVRDSVLKEPVLGAWKTALSAKGILTPESVWNATPRDADPNADDWILKNWDVDPVADQDFVKAIVPETAAVKMGTWIGATSALLEYDNTQRLPGLSVPTLVLWGTQDAIFYKVPYQTGLLDALKVAKAPFAWKPYGTTPLPDTGYQENEIGHNVQWDAPKEVAADIASFIKTGLPTPDHYRAQPGADGFAIVTEEGKAETVSGPVTASNP